MTKPSTVTVEDLVFLRNSINHLHHMLLAQIEDIEALVKWADGRIEQLKEEDSP
jgi:hypothetical protein